MAGSYLGTTLQWLKHAGTRWFASRAQQQQRAIRLDGWPTPANQTARGRANLGGRLKLFHCEGELPADWETVVMFSGSRRGRREDVTEITFNTVKPFWRSYHSTTCVVLQSHTFDDIEQLGEEGKRCKQTETIRTEVHESRSGCEIAFV